MLMIKYVCKVLTFTLKQRSRKIFCIIKNKPYLFPHKVDMKEPYHKSPKAADREPLVQIAITERCIKSKRKQSKLIPEIFPLIFQGIVPVQICDVTEVQMVKHTILVAQQLVILSSK